jgi:hypothetical protein
MRVPTIVAAFAAALLIPLAAGDVAAQDDESGYSYASYYQCGPGQGRAFEIIRDLWGPMVQAQMDAGTISAWGTLAHNTGNPWSMLIYHRGEDLNALNEALEGMVSQFGSEHGDAAAEFEAACPRHEDYIWTTGPGSETGAGAARILSASAALAVYMVCDEGREAVADLIVEEVFAPIYDKQVEEGRLNGWGWLSHYVGGKYRRLLSMDGADHASLLEARSQILSEIGSEHGALAAAFTDVCNGHQDVMWDIVISAP